MELGEDKVISSFREVREKLGGHLLRVDRKKNFVCHFFQVSRWGGGGWIAK